MPLQPPTIDVEMAQRRAGATEEEVSQFSAPRSATTVTGDFTVGTRTERLSAVNLQSGDRWLESDTGWVYRYTGTAWAWAWGLYKGTDAQRGAIAPAAADNGAEFLTTDTTPRKFYRVSATAWTLVGVLLNAQGAAVTDYADNIAGTVSDTLAAIPDPADAPVDADALREDLVTNVLPKIRSAISSIASKQNTERSRLRGAGVIA